MAYVFSRQATSDLVAISDYIAVDNPKAAKRVIRAIRETCKTIGDMPSIGKKPMFVSAPDILYRPAKKYSQYLIFYRENRNKGGIEIVRVIHGARHLPNAYYEK